MNLESPLDTFLSLNLFSLALDLLLPVVLGVATMSLVAAAVCLLGLFVADLRQAHQGHMHTAASRWAGQFASYRQVQGRHAKFGKYF